MRSQLNVSRASSIRYLPLSSAISKPKNIEGSAWLEKPNVIRGAQYLLAQQQDNPGKIYWRDHLPQLFARTTVDGREKNFYFVNDKTTITPIRGERVDIKIKENFILPSGVTEISLRITQGKGKNEKSFKLLINSSALPLSQGVKCSLDLGYTYGEEQPYQLIFKPVDEEIAPFISLQAEWQEPDLNNQIESLFPDFPVNKSIDELRSFGDKKTDILDWAEENFQEIIEYDEFYSNGESQKHIKLDLTNIVWRKDRYGNGFGYVDDIIVREKDFDVFDQSLKFVSCEVIEDNKGKSAKNITPLGELSRRDLQLIEKLASRWRFPFITLFDQGRSLNDDWSKNLRSNAKWALDAAENLINGYQEKLESRLFNELWKMVTYFHKDMPISLSEKLIGFSCNGDGLRSKNLLIAYALGDLSCDWQQKILTNILNSVDDYGDTRTACLEMISIASWRHKNVILSLNLPQIEQVSKKLNLAFKGDINKLKGNNSPDKWNSLLRRLELLLALMRCRASDDNEIKNLLAVGSPISDQFEQVISKVNESLGEGLYNAMKKDNKIFSRVKLNLRKPKGYSKTVDILYALKLYLTGEDGVNQITITELVSDM